jgi:hypothetical protein
VTLYDPTNHRPLAGAPWSEAVARAGIAEIASDAVAAFRGRRDLWPNAPEDLDEGDVDMPYRNVYFGAAGVGWALQRLARDDLGPELPGAGEMLSGLAEDYRRDPELVPSAPEAGPAVSLLFGETGLRLAAHAGGGDGDLDALADCVARGRACPTRELCWGSPGTMTAALAMWRRTGEARWRELWLDSAGWLLEQWEDPIWEQDLYGRRRRFVGAGHGFAGNAAALLAGCDLLGDRAEGVARRCADALSGLAIEHDPLAQWPSRHGEEWKYSVQWCHGAPGMVISLAGLPGDPRTDALLIAGGELTWSAGALRKGPGLCHGTAGNAFAFLALHERTGDERWLARARAFAMDALADVRRRRGERGRGRYTLFTGDLGAALLLASCLRGDAAFPFLADL